MAAIALPEAIAAMRPPRIHIVGAASAAKGFPGKATAPLKRLPPKTVAPA